MKGIDVEAKPSGAGCVECLRDKTWWFHLRRCAQCGHIGCCDSSPNQHARRHFEETGHPIIRSFEPGESWFWSFPHEQETAGAHLAAPQNHPHSQTTPGPEELVPDNWQELLHED